MSFFGLIFQNQLSPQFASKPFKFHSTNSGKRLSFLGCDEENQPNRKNSQSSLRNGSVSTPKTPKTPESHSKINSSQKKRPQNKDFHFHAQKLSPSILDLQETKKMHYQKETSSSRSRRMSCSSARQSNTPVKIGSSRLCYSTGKRQGSGLSVPSKRRKLVFYYMSTI